MGSCLSCLRAHFFWHFYCHSLIARKIFIKPREQNIHFEENICKIGSADTLHDGMKGEIQPCLVCASQQQGRVMFPGCVLGLVPFDSDDSDLPHKPGLSAAMAFCPGFMGLTPAQRQRQQACGSSKKPLEAAVAPRTHEGRPSGGAGCL